MSNHSIVQTTPKVTIDDVLSRLKKLRKTHRGWIACCPVESHNDKNPSLSIAESNDGRILLYCHRGCSYQEIVAAMGFSPGDLNPKQTPPRNLEEYREAKRRQEQRGIEKALEKWAAETYLILCEVHRILFKMLPDCDAKIYDTLNLTASYLDILQFGNLEDKNELLEAFMRNECGLPGAWVNVACHEK